jgi:hypothetical protein
VIKKETENNLKYKDLITEIQRMKNGKTKVMPVITGRLEPFHSTQTVPEQLTGKARN